MLNVLKFIPGILLLQAATIGLVLIVPSGDDGWHWVRAAIPIMMVGFLTALWFASIATHQRKDEISRLKEHHAKERETIRVNAERAKSRVVKKAQHETLRQVRRSSRRATITVGLAFAGAAGLGGLLVLTQFMSWGVLTLAVVGGAAVGYVLRIRQENRRLPPVLADPSPPLVDAPTPPRKKVMRTYRAADDTANVRECALKKS
jgi:hypothetical protein